MASTSGSKRSIVELMQVEESARDLTWLEESLQNAVELELATLPVYLSGLWSIQEQSGEVYNLIMSVAMEEMLHYLSVRERFHELREKLPGDNGK